jgi:Ribosome inactivating protein
VFRSISAADELLLKEKEAKMADIITCQEDAAAATAPKPAPSRKHAAGVTRTLYRFLGVVAALAITLTAFISGTGTAKADTNQWSVSHVYMGLGNGPSQTQQSQYYGLITSLRNAAGHAWRNNVQMTQLDAIHSLIRLDLTYAGTTLQLWFTGNNLYLRGFTDTQGNTYSFDDYDLQGAMRPASAFSYGGGLLPTGAFYTLPYGSDYNSLVQQAGRGRESMPISWNDMWGSYSNLANADGANGASDVQNFARSLMFMVQFTSESARFYDVYGVMADLMLNYGTQVGDAGYYYGLPAVQQELENSWSQISQYATNLSNNTNPPDLYVGPSTGTLTSFGDVQARLAEGIAIPTEVSTTGDWWHTEL